MGNLEIIIYVICIILIVGAGVVNRIILQERQKKIRESEKTVEQKIKELKDEKISIKRNEFQSRTTKVKAGDKVEFGNSTWIFATDSFDEEFSYVRALKYSDVSYFVAPSKFAAANTNHLVELLQQINFQVEGLEVKALGINQYANVDKDVISENFKQFYLASLSPWQGIYEILNGSLASTNTASRKLPVVLYTFISIDDIEYDFEKEAWIVKK